MEDDSNIKVSGWVKERLERIRKYEGHSSLDSVIRSLFFRSVGLEANTADGLYKVVRKHSNELDGLIASKVPMPLEEVYENVESLICMVSLRDKLDKDGPSKTIEWVKKEDPDFIGKLLAFREKMCRSCTNKEPCAQRDNILKALDTGVNAENFESLIWPESPRKK